MNLTKKWVGEKERGGVGESDSVRALALPRKLVAGLLPGLERPSSKVDLHSAETRDSVRARPWTRG